MGKVNKEIKNNFKHYTDLVDGRKNVKKSPIVLDEKGNNIHYKKKNTSVTHTTEKDDINLIVESKIINKKDFKFKLRAKEYTEPPFFRFDSDGVTHRNNIPEIPLADQQITTPHFHKFDDKGREIAYKTKQLKTPTEAKALEDINLCVSHFCNEGNLRYNVNDFPKIDDTSGEIGFDISDEDPHSKIKF